MLFSGGMAERLNAAVLKTVDRAIGPWVQIPLPPPFMIQRLYGKNYKNQQVKDCVCCVSNGSICGNYALCRCLW